MTYENLPEDLRTLGEGTSKVFEYLSKYEKLKNTKERLEDHYLRLDIEEMVAILKSGKLLSILH